MDDKKQTEQSSADIKKDASENLNESQELLNTVFKEFEENYRNKNISMGIVSGFEKFDYFLQGFRDGDLNIIASRPSIGKTSFALTMFSNITAKGIKALYISFEKYENELIKSLLSIRSDLITQNLKSGILSQSNIPRLFEAGESINNNSDSIYLKTFHKADLAMLKDFIKRKIDEEKIKIVFIDYLTMITSETVYANRWEQVAEVSRSLKSMAMEFKVPFIVLCPLHRNIVDKKPEVADLSESGSIEYEADRVIILYEDKTKKHSNDFNEVVNEITVYVAKNRRGRKQTFDFDFIQHINKFVESEHEIKV